MEPLSFLTCKSDTSL